MRDLAVVRPAARGGAVLLAVWAAGCGFGGSEPATPDPAPEVVVRPMPAVQVEQVAGGEAIVEVEPGAPLGVPLPPLERRGERVTLTAVGTDVRALLTALADAAGVNLVVGPGVQGRVTVHFDDVPAAAALERVVVETGHMIARPLTAPFPATEFFVVPVNVNEADPETIQARFGVSAELARFLVRARIPPPS